MEIPLNDRIKFTSPQLLPLFNDLQSTHSLDYMFSDPASRFLMIFREVFMNSETEYQMKDGNFGASRSNWTYTIAYSFLTTAKIMGYDCVFETEGKRDAVIKTKDTMEAILYSEWEWDYQSVFGKGKEIEKLLKSIKKSKIAAGFLFTYVPESEYKDYLIRIIDLWQQKNTRFEDSPLILMTVLFSQGKGFRDFQLLRTCLIFNDTAIFWEDHSF